MARGALAAGLVFVFAALGSSEDEACTELESTLTLTMTNTAAGGGWGGNAMVISGCSGVVFAEDLTLADGAATGTATACVPTTTAEEGLVFEVQSYGSWGDRLCTTRAGRLLYSHL